MPTKEDIFKTSPRPYQRALVMDHAEDPYFYVQWEQGVGKTKPLIDIASWLWTIDKIDLLLVVAPNGVHFNWVDHELPKHMAVPYKAHALNNSKDTDNVKAHAAAMKEALAYDPEHLSVLTISYHALLKDSLITLYTKGPKRGVIEGRLADLVHGRRAMFVGDELVSIKDPDGEMSKKAVALAARCRYRWGADGTPVDNGPNDLYAQYRVLDARFWEKHSIGSLTSFKARFNIQKSVNVTVYTSDKQGNPVVKRRYNPETKEMEPVRPQQTVGYKNLKELNAIIAPVSSRITKEEAGLNLPPKVYVYEPFEMTKKQREVYDKMKRDFMVEVTRDGQTYLVDAAMAMTRLIRFQQITCGYLPVDSEGKDLVEIDPGKDPRLDALVGLVERQTTQGLLWATYRPCRDKIINALGSRVLCYRAEDSDDQKRATIAKWKAGGAQYLMGHVAGGLARGHTLIEADHVIYHQNMFRHAPRKQSEDRAHRIGQERVVSYFDIVARKSVDQHVVKNLIEKDSWASETLGDMIREWLK